MIGQRIDISLPTNCGASPYTGYLSFIFLLRLNRAFATLGRLDRRPARVIRAPASTRPWIAATDGARATFEVVGGL
jgi:hypothetical protein